jgi:dienelactone hydrolase
MAEREDVEFTSNGATLRGWLYPAANASAAEPGSAVVMAHGLSAVKEMFLDDYAAAFAAAGFTTLAFDNFGFGASDGEPRQSPAPDLLLAGYRDAVAWIARQPAVDPNRIAIWGSSLSGGIVISLAAETIGIACAVAQVPNFGEGAAEVPAGLLEEFGRVFETGALDTTVPAVTATPDGVGVMYEDGAYDWFTRVAAERAPSWRNELLVTGIVALGAHRPIDDLGKARVPLLLLVAPGDHLTPPGPAMRIAQGAPNVEVVEIPGNHFDAYEAGFQASSQPALDWFRRHLRG